MKKALGIFLVSIMMLSFVACSGDKTNAQLSAEGWVKDPEQNGYIKKSEPDALSAASTKTAQEKQLEPEQIRELAVDYLRGWEYKKDNAGKTIWSYREMYQIATSFGGNPGISTVEYTLDPETMRLYTGNEKGTQKLNHFAQNPYVELYYVKQVPEEKYVPGVYDYWSSYGVKLTGKARVLTPDYDNEEFVKCASLALSTNMGAARWDAMDKAAQIEYIKATSKALDYYVIDLEEVIVVSLWWMFNKPGMEKNPRGLYDPKHIGFDKNVYQFYTVKR